MKRRKLSKEKMLNASEKAHIRLLDMLAGWSEFADDVEEPYCDNVSALYQEAGNLDATEKEVKEFVETKIIPYLLKGKS